MYRMKRLINSKSQTHSQSIYEKVISVLYTANKKYNVVGLCQEHCLYLPAMMGWFFFSALLSVYNKYMFGDEHLAFPCPLLVTSVHFGVHWIFGYTFGNDNTIDQMTWKEYFSIGIPCGIITASDVGISNLSLVRISITFYTMVKSSAPIFVVISAYILGINKDEMSWALVLVVLTICCGEVVTVLGEVQFDLIGFALVLTASICSGIRWTLVQMKIQAIQPPLQSTIATMRLLAPIMFVSMLSFSIIIERPWTVLINENALGFNHIAMAFGGGLIAIVMILCEFYLIMKSSAMVLMIGGVLKELTTILAGITIFGDEINAVNLFGCFIIFTGVLLYKLSRYIQKLEKECNALEQKCMKNSIDDIQRLIYNDDDGDDEEKEMVSLVARVWK